MDIIATIEELLLKISTFQQAYREQHSYIINKISNIEASLNLALSELDRLVTERKLPDHPMKVVKQWETE